MISRLREISGTSSRVAHNFNVQVIIVPSGSEFRDKDCPRLFARSTSSAQIILDWPPHHIAVFDCCNVSSIATSAVSFSQRMTMRQPHTLSWICQFLESRIPISLYASVLSRPSLPQTSPCTIVLSTPLNHVPHHERPSPHH